MRIETDDREAYYRPISGTMIYLSAIGYQEMLPRTRFRRDSRASCGRRQGTFRLPRRLRAITGYLRLTISDARAPLCLACHGRFEFIIGAFAARRWAHCRPLSFAASAGRSRSNIRSTLIRRERVECDVAYFTVYADTSAAGLPPSFQGIPRQITDVSRRLTTRVF